MIQDQPQGSQNYKADSQSSTGYRVEIQHDEIESTNTRVLGQAAKTSSFFIPAEWPLPLLFFRLVFTHLREELKDEPGGRGSEADENIPIESFQRTLERLFYVLREKEPFDARLYDGNDNGFVGWQEFCTVFKKKDIRVALTLKERIFLTFDNPDSSVLAKLISYLVLLTIIVSSVCFIISTMPECQDHPSDDIHGKPVPSPIFEIIERVCLVLFIIEYAIRLSTCWGVRSEVFNEARLIELTTGVELIHLPSPLTRMFRFVFFPSNLIDLAAILPGMVGLIPTVNVSGGGFVVLRLIRLTRVIRAFQALRGPAIVITRTIQQSTKALYVLAFNLMLGIVIAGSLMWLVEGGTWDREEQTYMREAGRNWTDGVGWEPDFEESPFLSIPHAFWWAIVTAMTVGYGERNNFPRSALGYVIAVITMLFSLVILALPVGVIGGTFGQEWEQFEEEKKEENLRRRNEQIYTTSAVQRMYPQRLQNLMFVEVWNERFPPEVKQAWGTPAVQTTLRPEAAEFMGQCRFELEMPEEGPEVVHELCLPLRSDTEMVERHVSGRIRLRTTWAPPEDKNEDALTGTLKVELLSGERLTNLNNSEWRISQSNPYCLIFCYPTSPSDSQDLITPCIWRSPTMTNTLSPVWHCVGHTFKFCWQKERRATTLSVHHGVSSPKAEKAVEHSSKDDTLSVVPVTSAKSCSADFTDVLSAVNELRSQLREVRDSVSAVSGRVDEISERARRRM